MHHYKTDQKKKRFSHIPTRYQHSHRLPSVTAQFQSGTTVCPEKSELPKHEKLDRRKNITLTQVTSISNKVV